MKFNKLDDLDTFRWERIKGAELEGKYDMPKLHPVHDVEPENLVPFHMAKTAINPEQRWFHFYEDDYQFEQHIVLLVVQTNHIPLDEVH